MSSPASPEKHTLLQCLHLVLIGSLGLAGVVIPGSRVLAADGHSAHHTMPKNGMERAGNPRCISPLAKCFPDIKYKGYYVGGGAAWHHTRSTAFRGEGRMSDEGTFGVDYAPWYSRVQQRWLHGRKQQGGEGQYESDAYNNPLDDHLGFGPYKKAPRLFPHH